jgi:hypothetical protein
MAAMPCHGVVPTQADIVRIMAASKPAAFQTKRMDYDMKCSMRRQGIGWQNKRGALARAGRGPSLARCPTESWFNSFKNGRLHGVHFAARAEIKAEVLVYLEVFYQRRQSSLGYRSPKQSLQVWMTTQ